MRSHAATAPLKWFLPDRPVTTSTSDVFSHADVADNLYMMISGAEADDRQMIGLLGPFGVGKSTVIQLLAEQMNTGDQIVLRISAERHEQPGLHRSLIYAFAEELDRVRGVDSDHIKDILDTLQYATTRTGADLSTIPLLKAPAAVKQLANRSPRAIVVGAGLTALLAVSAILVGILLQWELAAAILGALYAISVSALAALPVFMTRTLSGWVSDVTKSGTQAKLRARIESADEYERAFADLVKLSKRQLIIAVDDIDRLSPTEVLVALNAIRSFQLTCTGSKPVFIVSADEEIIEAALLRAQPGLAAKPSQRQESAQAFLDRLFTHRQEMPVHAPADLDEFLKERLTSGDHIAPTMLGEELDPVIDVLLHDGVTDPRHALRLVNAFFGDLRLAWRREGQSGGTRSITVGAVTHEPQFLARMTVLKVDFPRFHRALFNDDALLSRLETDIDTSQPLDASGIAAMGYETRSDGSVVHEAEWSELRAFVGRTASLRPVDDLRPFLYLGQGELDRVIGGALARQARASLTNRQVGDFSRALEVAAAQDDDGAQLRALTELASQTLRRSRGLDLRATVPTLLPAVHLLHPDGLSDIAAGVANALKVGVATPAGTGPLFTLASAADEKHIQRSLAERVVAPEDGALSADAAFVVLEHRRALAEMLGPDMVAERLREALEALPEATAPELAHWLEQVDRTPIPDMADLIVGAVTRVMLTQEADLSANQGRPLRQHFQYLRSTSSDFRENPLDAEAMMAAATLIGVDVDSAISSVLLDELVAFTYTHQDAAILATAVHRGTIHEEDVIDAASSSWPAALRLLRHLVETSNEEIVASHTSNILVAYASIPSVKQHRREFVDVLGALARTSPDSTDAVIQNLAQEWGKSGMGPATDDSVATGVLKLLPIMALHGQQHVLEALTVELNPSSHQHRLEAAISQLASLGASEATVHLLQDVTRGQIQFINVNGPSLTNVRLVLQALSSWVEIEPEVSAGIITRYANVMQYGSEWVREGLDALLAIEWNAAALESALPLMVNYANRMRAANYWSLVLQLARTGVSLPASLMPGVRESLIVHRKQDEADRPAVLQVAAQLETKASITVALRIEGGHEIVQRRPAADVDAAVEALVDVVIDDDALLESTNTEAVVAALWLADGAAFSGTLKALALTQIQGGRRLSAAVWSVLLKGGSDDSRVVVGDAMDAAEEQGWLNGQSFFEAALATDPGWMGERLEEKLIARLRSGSHDRTSLQSLAQVLATSEAPAISAHRKIGKSRAGDSDTRIWIRSLLLPTA